MANALKIINAEVNRQQKKFPNKKRKTLQKEAGKKYRDGKLKSRPKRKKAVRKKAVRKARKPRRKVGSVGRAHTRKRAAPRRRKPAKVRVITKTRTRTVTKYKARRVGGSKTKQLGLIALLAAGAIIVYAMTRNKSVPPLVITNNPARNTTAQNIINYAAAAGATASAIAKIIQQLNASSDTKVAALNTAIQTAPDLSDDGLVSQILNNNNNIAGYRLN